MSHAPVRALGPIVLTLERIDHATAFEALREEWNELLAASAADGLFLTWEWLSHWWRHLSAGQRLALTLVRAGRQLVAIAPLVVRRRRIAGILPVRSLELLGTGSVGSDYLDVIVRRGHERAVRAALAQRFTTDGVMLDLAQLHRDASVAGDLARDLDARGWVRAETVGQVCPFIDLRGHSWASYLAGLGKEHRYNVQRRLRNAGRAFDLRFEPARSEDERRTALGLLLRLHDLRFGERSDAFHTPALRAFHEDLSRAALARGWLRLFVLSLDGQPAAALYAFAYRRRFYFYQSGFDPAFAKWSVGLLAMGLAIKHAIEEGAEEYDLLHGDEGYKFHWATQSRALTRLELYPPTVRDRFRRQVREASRSGRRLARRLLPEPVADRITVARRLGVRRLWMPRPVTESTVARCEL